MSITYCTVCNTVPSIFIAGTMAGNGHGTGIYS
jgi:hypothetical protein